MDEKQTEHVKGEQDDPTLTRRVDRPSSVKDELEPEEAKIEDAPTAPPGIFQQIWRRIQEERRRPKRVEVNTRGQNNMDRSKAFLVLGTTVVLAGFAFLALFSSPGAEKRAQEKRTRPSLGRPESSVQQAGRPGSTIPLLSADQTGGDPNGEQLSPDDILATSRRAQTSNPQPQPPANTPNQYALSNSPAFSDPALDAYRRQYNVA
jgi:hypothetical protein